MDTKISALTKEQYSAVSQGLLLDVEQRIQLLKKLLQSIEKFESKINEALRKDLKKSEFETYVSEVGFVYEDIRFAIKNVKKWAKPKKIKTPWVHFYSQSYVYPEPLGRVLIIAPWNYPVQLLLSPAIGAIAAGNCVTLKPSELVPNTSAVIREMVETCFEKKYIACVEGGVLETEALLKEKFDHIFFTGSANVGRIVMRAASEHLTPVTLELGGKSPCIVDETANVDLAARRVAWGKFFNAGQTCVAPDYVLIHPSIKEEFIQKTVSYIAAFYGQNPAESIDYGKIVNKRHFNRLQQLLQGCRVVHGGIVDEDSLYISPTILTDIAENIPIMKEEIFGPLLPILEYQSFDSAVAYVKQHPKPLALYLFSSDSRRTEQVLKTVSFGGGCINDTLIHLSCPELPFGGVGDSGLGAYHGKYSFDTFSHFKSVLKKTFLFDIPLRYPPYRDKLKLVKKIMG